MRETIKLFRFSGEEVLNFSEAAAIFGGIDGY